MAEWTVSPSEGVINNNNGTFTFPSNNLYKDKNYVVTYTDSGCTCSINVVVRGLVCYNDYTHGTGTSTPESCTCDGQYVSVYGSVPYTSYTRTVNSDYTSCDLTGDVYYGNFDETASVWVSENTGTTAVVHTGTASSTYGWLTYSITQGTGCTPVVKEYPTDNHSKISTENGKTAESYASDAGTVTVTGDAYIDGGAIWTDVSVAGASSGDYLGSYTVYCTNTTKYYSGYSVSIYYHSCPGGCE